MEKQKKERFIDPFDIPKMSKYTKKKDANILITVEEVEKLRINCEVKDDEGWVYFDNEDGWEINFQKEKNIFSKNCNYFKSTTNLYIPP